MIILLGPFVIVQVMGFQVDTSTTTIRTTRRILLHQPPAKHHHVIITVFLVIQKVMMSHEIVTLRLPNGHLTHGSILQSYRNVSQRD